MAPTKIDEMEEKLNQVLFYLHNDDKTGKRGIVQDIYDLKKDVHSIKSEIADFKTRIGILSIVASGIVTLAGWLIKLFIVK